MKAGRAGPPSGSFAAGAQVAIPGPDAIPLSRPIEQLRPGDTVLTFSGPSRPIRHIAQRRIDVASHPVPLRVTPVRLRAGALGPGIPQRDLLVPQEALLRFPPHSPPDDQTGMLVPTGTLANGRSIQRESAAGIITWYTIELDHPDTLLVENVPAASFRPSPTPAATPDSPATSSATESEGARPLPPLLPPGGEMLALRARLNMRAESLEFPTDSDPFAAGTADDPAHPLRLFANGNELPANADSTPACFTFTLPAGTGPVRLLSRDFESPAPQDKRRLGVCLVGLEMDGVTLDLEGAMPGHGFHVPEGNESMRWRWTNGDAWLVLPYHDSPRHLAIAITDWHLGLMQV